jgi:hypothetical protein
MSQAYVPGNTELPTEEHRVTELPSLAAPKKSIIVLATNDVNDHSLFLNGLTQNILVLYDLFASMGYSPYLLQHSGSSEPKKSFIHNYRTVTTDAIVKQGMPVKLFIEVGMSVDALTRGYLRGCGCRIAKLYLGNILNIDVETIQNYRSFFFHHHLVGEIDEIWTSPHYLQHVDYAAILNRTDPATSRVVPYVWDPCFLRQYAAVDKPQLEWTPPAGGWEKTDLVIMDPNISFQKYAFYTLLLAEAFAKAHPEWKGHVHVINGDRLRLSANALNRFLPCLTTLWPSRIQLHGRKTFHTILRDHPSCCFLTHQWNNAYNYMLLEALHCHYPVLHNSDGWLEYGYSYSTEQWPKAIDTLYRALKDHHDRLPVYRAHAAQLIQKHSIHDPDIRRRWAAILSTL